MKIELKNSPGVKRAALWKSHAAAERVERLDAVAIEADDCGIFKSENIFQPSNSGRNRIGENFKPSWPAEVLCTLSVLI